MKAALVRRLAGALGWIGLLALGCGPATPPVVEPPPPPVTVSQPLVKSVIDHDDFEGRIAAAQTVEVRARVRGHLVKVNFEDGQLVKKGDLLYEIDPRQYKASLDSAKAMVASAEASLALAKSEYDRASRLASKGAASREEVEIWAAKQGTAAADRLKAAASVEQAQNDLDFTKIAAPIDGKISRTQVDVGNLVNAGGGETLLTTLVSVEPMYVYFNVDERSLLRYRRDFPRKGEVKSLKALQIPVQVALEGEEGHPHKGVIDFGDNRVNPSTGTILVRGVLANPNRLFEDGMRARVRVPVSDPHQSVLVTERAIGTDQGRRFVYVVNDKNVVERRDVTLERAADGLQAIQGLKPDDWVIVTGIQRVREGMKVQPQRSAMPGAEKLSAEPPAK